MTSRSLTTLALAGLACLGLGRPVAAQEQACGLQAGSLLVYPIFDNTRGTFTILTVTNTNDDVVTGSVKVEFVYIDEYTCLEFNRTHLLTANDTLSVLTKVHNPNMVRGYCYVFAKSPTTGQAIAWDHLVGTDLFLGSTNVYDFEADAIVFQAGEGLAQGAPTDLDSDGIRDLDGVEYAQAPDQIIVPRFFANDGGVCTELVLIGLTGARFETIIDFLIYNDNEEVFSAQYSFDCWQRVSLPHISGVFEYDFLRYTNQNPNEIQGQCNDILEAGWYRMDGHIAFSTTTSVDDPAFLALQMERLHGGMGGPTSGASSSVSSAVATLPFGKGVQDNGGLLAQSPAGNP